jgi:epsin
MDSLFGKLKHEAVKLKREAKKVAELETPLEKKLREATSNQNWGCPNSVLYDIANAAKDFHDRRKILCKIEEKLQSEPHRWRRIYKTLTLLEFILKNGSEDILPDMLAEQQKVRRFTSFSYLEEGKERGDVIRQKANSILELAGNRELLRASREEAQAHRSKMTGEGTRESGGHAPRRAAPQSASRASMEQRFNELKKKRDEEKGKHEVSRTLERDREKPPDNDRSSDNKCIKIAPPGTSPSREANLETPADNGFVLFDGVGDPNSDSDSDGPTSRNKASSEEVKDKAPSAPSDLLDLMGEPEHPPAASQEWANFGATSPDLLGGFDAPPQQSPQVMDMFSDSAFLSDAPPTGAQFGQMQQPIFTGSINPVPPPVTLQPPAYTASAGYVTAPPVPLATVASPFDGPWAQTGPSQETADTGGKPPNTPAPAPSFLDDMPGELWDLNLTGSSNAAPKRGPLQVR